MWAALEGFRLDVWGVLSDSGQVEVANGCVRVWGIKAFSWWMVETRSSCWKGERVRVALLAPWASALEG